MVYKKKFIFSHFWKLKVHGIGDRIVWFLQNLSQFKDGYHISIFLSGIFSVQIHQCLVDGLLILYEHIRLNGDNSNLNLNTCPTVLAKAFGVSVSAMNLHVCNSVCNTVHSDLTHLIYILLTNKIYSPPSSKPQPIISTLCSKCHLKLCLKSNVSVTQHVIHSETKILVQL